MRLLLRAVDDLPVPDEHEAAVAEVGRVDSLLVPAQSHYACRTAA